MKVRLKQSGVSLTEMAVVVAVISLLVGLSLPGIRAFYNSFESQGSTRAMISAALSSARAIAVKEQHYAGIRFQTAYNRDAAEPNAPFTASQYLIFIVHDVEGTGLANGFRAVKGIKPIKLPDSVGVMDLQYRPDLLPAGDGIVSDDTETSNPNVVRDTITFSIIFSPSGKLVIHQVQVRNRDGIPDSKGRIGDSSADDVFNKKAEVDAGIGMFYQDDYFGASWSPYAEDLGLGPEFSRNKFIIYDRIEFKQAYSGYLSGLVPIYINPYTGAMISTD